MRQFLAATALVLLGLPAYSACQEEHPAQAASGSHRRDRKKEDAAAKAKLTSPGAQAQLPEWKFAGFSEVSGAPEPSGLCYVPETATFYLVDDGDYITKRPSAVLKLDEKGTVLQRSELGKDLEGVCWCPDLGSILVADEANETVYLLDPDSLAIEGSFEVKDKIGEKKAFQQGGNGFEGIEYLPASATGSKAEIVLLNQDDPTCLLLLPVTRIKPAQKGQKLEAERRIELEQINAGEVRYNHQTDEFWVIHSWMNITEILDPKTFALRRWVVMPGCAQEGVAFDKTGRMWVGQDTGGIAVYDPLTPSK